MTTNSSAAGARLVAPLYSLTEADHLAGVSHGTARRWLHGYRYLTSQGQQVERPPVTIRPRDEGGASFVDLVELVAIGKLKEFGFALPKIRAMVQTCQELLAVVHPLASLRFKTDGRDIFVEHNEQLLDVLHHRGAQAWNEVLGPFLETLDYQDEFARRWWPMGKGHLVVVDPEYGFGLPVIAGSGVRTELVIERFNAGAGFDEIAEDFNISPDSVEQAVRFETTRLAA